MSERPQVMRRYALVMPMGDPVSCFHSLERQEAFEPQAPWYCYADGAALQVQGEGSKATVQTCDFMWNALNSIGCFNGGSVSVLGCTLARNDGCCVLASGPGSRVSLENVTISDGTGTAMKARHTAVLDASGVTVTRCLSGLEGKSCATITCTQSSFKGCSLQACGSFGGARMSLTGVQVFATAGRALHTAGACSSLRCVDCKLFRSTGTQALGELSASLNLEGVHIAEGTGDGIVITGQDTAGVINTCTVMKQQGAGVRVKSGGVTCSGSSISACGSAISVEQAGSVDLTDAWISDCNSGVVGGCGAKIRAHSSSFVNVGGTAALSLRSEGTHGEMQACCVRSCAQGCVLAEAGARFKMAECKFEHNGAPCVHGLGSSSAVGVDQCTFEGNAGPCIRAACGASAIATDCCIRTTDGSAVCIRGRESTGKLERCALKETCNHVVIAQAGGSCLLDSCTIERSRAGAGLVALGEGSRIKCTGGSVAEMQQAACVVKDAAAVHCESVQLQQTFCGSGCIATAGGVFTARSCSLQDNSDHGVMVAEGGCAQLQACKCESPCK